MYNYIFNEFGSFPFQAVEDGADVYFTKSACSWGQVWTKAHWNNFYSWLRDKSKNIDGIINSRIPRTVRDWSSNSWKRLFNIYLAEKELYYVVPRFSICTNTGAVGTNYFKQQSHFSSPLLLAEKEWNFTPLEGSSARYDPFFEIEPESLFQMNNDLPKSLGVDIYGQKELKNFSENYLITTRQHKSSSRLVSFGMSLFPPELNVALKLPGNELAVVPRCEVEDSYQNDILSKIRNFYVVEDSYQNKFLSKIRNFYRK